MASNRKLIVEIVGDSRSLEKAFKKSNDAAQGFSHKMGRVAKGAALGLAGVAAAAGALGVAVGINAVKAASSFETSLSRIIGLAGQSAGQVKKWGDQLLSLGPALGKTPQELADALYFIASSGVPASKAISVLTASAKASAAGLGETAVVADAVTSVMNAYSSSNMSAAHATDILVATVREGKGEADQFAGVIGNIAAFAAKLHVPFEQVGAALAAMTQLGTDPHTAATQLQAFFSQILKVSEPMQKKAKKLGLGDIFTELQTSLVKGDLLGALRQLKGIGPLQLAQIFPNVRAVRAALALVETGGGRVAGIFTRMAHSSGSMRKAFLAAQKTSQHSFEVFSASIQALKIAFGQGLLPVINQAAVALGEKLANPAFVARVRLLGILVGQKLRVAFIGISTWFSAHWPQIMSFLRAMSTLITRISQGVQILVQNLQRLADFAGHFGFIPKAIKGVAGGLNAGANFINRATGTEPGGKGTVHVNGNLIVYGAENPNQLAEKIHRQSKKKTKQTRGRSSPGLYHK